MAVKAILHIMERDIRYFFRFKWWVAGMISMNLADLFIMAVVYTKMVKQDVVVNYFVFFAPGLTITALFAAAFMIGREVNIEIRRDIIHYMLSLPMKRWELAFGRVLAGGVRGLLYMSPLMLTTLAITYSSTRVFPTLVELFTIAFVLFLISIGTSGLSISLALSTTSLEKYITMRGVVYYVLFFCSTVFYPITLIQSALPTPLVVIAKYNPLSCGADLSRTILLRNSPFAYWMLFDVSIFALFFALIAAFAYKRAMQK